MDGHFSLVLLALLGQELTSGLRDLGVLAMSLLLAMLSTLALTRQVLNAMSLGK